MKKDECSKVHRSLNNKGFSLVELIISIAVLVIIMVPLMNNFFRSMQLNQKAKKLQIQSNLAASIMESVKANELPAIIEQFNRGIEDFDLIPEEAKEVLRLKKVDTDKYDIYVTSDGEQATYYFAIHGISVGSTAYDALVTIDSDPAANQYKQNDGTMNRYPMPEVINLDEKANGLVFSNGTTEEGKAHSDAMDTAALNDFISMGSSYAQTKLEQTPEYQSYLEQYEAWKDACVLAEINNTTPPAEPVKPTLASYAAAHPEYDRYIDPVTVKQYVTKTMKLTVNNKTLDYAVEYSCSWPVGSNIQSSISNQISKVNYAKTIENIYLFYTPSIYQSSHSADKIVLQKVSENPVSLFVAKQGMDTMVYPVIIQRIGDGLSAYTDLPGTGFISYVGDTQETGNTTINNNIVKTKEEDRIYSVTVEICSYPGEGTPVSGRYKDVLYKLESTLVR